MSNLESLQQQKDILEERILNIVSQILDELEIRLKEFGEGVGERIFKAYPQVSNQFQPEVLGAFKKDLRQAYEESVADIIGTLADEDYWLNIQNNYRGKESLRDNQKAWGIIQKIGQDLTPVFKKYGYPARTGTLMAPYKEAELEEVNQLPKAEQLKLLTVKYWFYVTKYYQILVEMKRMSKEINHQNLDQMWNSVD